MLRTSSSRNDRQSRHFQVVLVEQASGSFTALALATLSRAASSCARRILRRLDHTVLAAHHSTLGTASQPSRPRVDHRQSGCSSAATRRSRRFARSRFGPAWAVARESGSRSFLSGGLSSEIGETLSPPDVNCMSCGGTDSTHAAVRVRASGH